jgi:hypothetical protein
MNNASRIMKTFPRLAIIRRRRGDQRRCVSAWGLVMMAMGIALFSFSSGCRSTESPAASESDLEKYSKAFRGSGGPDPYFGYNERAREVEKHLGL